MSAFTKYRKTIWGVALIVIVIIYLFLFHTAYGLWIQYSASLRIQCPTYTRLLSSRFASNGDVRFRKLAAEMLMALAGKDLYDAQSTWSTVIATQPDAKSYSARGYTYMYQRRYTNAVADYEKAVRLWDPHDWTGDVSARGLSNDLEIAKICAQAESNKSAGTR